MNFIRKIITSIAIILPLLHYYESYLLGISLIIPAQVIIVTLAIFVILIKRIVSLNIIRENLIMSIWIIFTTLLSASFVSFTIFSSETINNILLFIIFTVGLSLGLLGAFDFSFGIKLYYFISIMAMIFLVIQIVSFYIIGKPIGGKIPFFMLSDRYYDAFSYLNTKAITGGYVRFSSFFSEPSHYAQYIFPLLCMKLFGYKNIITKNIIHSLLITILLLLSTSANGIILSGIVWIVYFFYKSKTNLITKITIPIISVVLILIVFNILMSFTFFSNAVDNLFAPSGPGQSKADYRIYRGFAMYKELPTIHKLIGAGYRSADAAASYYGIITKYDKVGALAEYFNSIAQILLYSGIVGGLLYFNMMKKIYINVNIAGKSILIAFIALSFSSSVFMEEFWQLYMLLICAVYNHTKTYKIV